MGFHATRNGNLMTKPRSKYERAIEVAADAFVEALLAGSDEHAGELMSISSELMYQCIRLAGGIVVLDGQERVKRTVQEQVWGDISTRAQAKLKARDLRLAAELVRESLQVLRP
jgi:hypothetical protein